MESKKRAIGYTKKRAIGYTPVPFTRAHSKPKRLGEFNRSRTRREERDAKKGQW